MSPVAGAATPCSGTPRASSHRDATVEPNLGKNKKIRYFMRLNTRPEGSMRGIAAELCLSGRDCRWTAGGRRAKLAGKIKGIDSHERTTGVAN
jgi:hypothetical protein